MIDTMSELTETIGKLIPYLLGGVGGASLTFVTNKVSNKMQRMKCYFIDDEVISRIPVSSATGEEHKNIYYKEFKLINTTNKDIQKFKIIFEFDADSKIIKHSTFSKNGKDILKPKKTKKLNELVFEINNFNRKDYVKFYFDIANVSRGHLNVTESECLGFCIKVKDVRKAKKNQITKIVSKEEIYQ